MSREKTLVKNTFIYMVGNFASRFLGLLLLPLYTNFLTDSQYGYFDYVVTMASIIIPVISLQINDSMYRYLLDEDSDTGANKVITSSFVVNIAGLVAFSFLFLIFINFKSIQFSFLILLYIITTVLSGIWQQIARGLKKNLAYSLAGVLFTAVMLVLNVLLILVFHQKLEALFYSNIVASVSVVLYLEFEVHVFKRLIIKKIEFNYIKKLAAYSVPLLPNALNWWVMSALNRSIILYFLGISANGIFAVSSKFPSILMAFGNVFTLAWQESAISEYQSKDKDEFYSKMFNYYMKFQLCMLLVLIPFTHWGMLIVGKNFADAWRYVPFLYVGTVFMAFSTFYGTGYLSSKDTKGAFTTSIAGAAVNIVLNLVLTPLIGLQAASLSSMIAYAALWGFRIFQTKKYFKISIDMKSLAILSVLSSVFIALYYFNMLIVDILMATAAIVIFFVFNRELTSRVFGFVMKKMSSKILKKTDGRGDDL